MPQVKLAPFPNGLVNLGNTCFFNVSIQCLARLTPLYQYVLSDEFLNSINPQNPNGSQGEIAVQFRHIVESMTKPTSVINPRALRTAFTKKFTKFANFNQHDAEEALNALLDTVADTLASGDKVQLVGFGSFETKAREARTGRNPKTKEPIEIPATKVPVFKAGKALKDRVAE